MSGNPRGYGSSEKTNRKAFSGRVTKLLDNFGFVDDEVFFQLSVFRGDRPVKTGDPVFVDCTYSEHLPFKWNAVDVQLIDDSNGSSNPFYGTTTTSGSSSGSQQPQDPRQDPRRAKELSYASRKPFLNDKNANAVPLGSDLNGQPNPRIIPYQSGQQTNQMAFSSAGNQNVARDQITYTSTPGSAFVQPFVEQINPAMLQQTSGPPLGSSRAVAMSGLTVAGVMGFAPQQNSMPGTGPATGPAPGRESRWDSRSDRNRERRRSNERKRSPRRDYPARVAVGGGPGKDQFGRDIPVEEGDSRRDQSNLIRSTVSPSNSTVTSEGNYVQLGKCDSIPRERLLKSQLTSSEIKNRYGNKIHIPSDFEVMLVNSDASFNITNIPRPIKFKFIDVKRPRDKKSKDDKKDDKKDNKSDEPKTDEKGDKTSSQEDEVIDEYKADNDKTDNDKKECPKDQEIKMEAVDVPEEEVVKEDKKIGEDQQPKKKHEVRYSAKVVLLSLPEMNEMYEKIFGYDFERSSYGFSTERSYPLSKLISFVTLKTEGGYSLLGGKFIQEKDSFVDGTTRPNLINTAIRTVKESTGIDLSTCTKWMSLATFVYNRSSSLEENLYEYSTVFMPDVWSLLGKTTPQEVTNSPQIDLTQESPEEEDAIISQEGVAVQSIPTSQEEHKSYQNDYVDNVLPNLKVAELKAELDKYDIKFGKTAKKADLVLLLKEHLQSLKHEKAADVTDDEEFNEDFEDNTCPDKIIVSGEVQVEKRKLVDEAPEEPPTKKSKEKKSNLEPLEGPVAVIKDCSFEVTSDLSLSCLSLYQGLNHHKNDHFELSLSAEILKESIIKDFGTFIISCLIANSSILKQESKNESSMRRNAKPPTLTQLVFSFFDDKHFGYMRTDEALQLLSSCGYTFSRKVWSNLTCGVDRIYYKNLEPPKDMFSVTQTFMDPLSSAETNLTTSSVFFKNGVMYDINNLIDQSHDFSKAQVLIKDLQAAIVEKTNAMTDYESRHKKMTQAIEKQNDELCNMKRDKDSMMRKTDDLKKIMESTLDNLNRGMRLLNRSRDSSTKESSKEDDKNHRKSSAENATTKE